MGGRAGKHECPHRAAGPRVRVPRRGRRSPRLGAAGCAGTERGAALRLTRFELRASAWRCTDMPPRAAPETGTGACGTTAAARPPPPSPGIPALQLPCGLVRPAASLPEPHAGARGRTCGWPLPPTGIAADHGGPLPPRVASSVASSASSPHSYKSILPDTHDCPLRVGDGQVERRWVDARVFESHFGVRERRLFPVSMDDSGASVWGTYAGNLTQHEVAVATKAVWLFGTSSNGMARADRCYLEWKSPCSHDRAVIRQPVRNVFGCQYSGSFLRSSCRG